MTMTSGEWLLLPTHLTLADSEVHVWRVGLAQPSATIEVLWRILDSDECKRAERFHFVRDRAHFIVARGLLRVILGHYMGVDPAQLCFCYNQYGKPGLALGDRSKALSFSLTHSHDLALYAITRDRAIGVDIEYVQADFSEMAIAEQFFSPREIAVLRALPSAMRRTAFFNCWTHKEAYIKARGEGLSLPLDQFTISLAPGASTELLDVVGDSEERSRWTLQPLDPGSDYVAALAVEGQDWILRRWQWLSLEVS